MSEWDFVNIAHFYYCKMGRGHTNRICESASYISDRSINSGFHSVD